jgi:hypothetical protein
MPTDPTPRDNVAAGLSHVGVQYGVFEPLAYDDGGRVEPAPPRFYEVRTVHGEVYGAMADKVEQDIGWVTLWTSGVIAVRVPTPDVRAIRLVDEDEMDAAEAARTVTEPQAVCCVCGSPDTPYENYRGQLFCWPCADGKPPKRPSPEWWREQLRVAPYANPDDAPRRSVDRWPAARAELCEALGLDKDEAIDVPAAARDMAQELARSREAVRSVVELHQGVSHRGQAICGHCSAWDERAPDAGTDNSPVDYPCATVKRIWEANGEAGGSEPEGPQS